MVLEIAAVGGYGEVGRNMTAVRCNGEVVILDCGIHLPNYVKLTDEETGDVIKFDEKILRKAGAIPDDRSIESWWGEVKAIIPSHAHLDHIGAIPYVEHKYNAPIIATPFAAAVLKTICQNERIKLRNQVRTLLPNSSLRLTQNITVEFIHVTHSTPQCVLIVIHTPDGIVCYGNDFKLDNSPTLGRKPNYESLEALGTKNVAALILEDLYANDPRKMPSEGIAKDMLQDVLLGVNSTGKALVVTTFSSHIARLKAIADMGKKLNRKVLFFGRSLAKYAFAAEDAGIAYFSKDGVKIATYGRQVYQTFKEVEANRDKYMLVMTGHQGEPKAMMFRVLQNQFAFKLKQGDHVVFSCNVIPADINKKNRAELERQLRAVGCRIFTDIHVSGHCAREDLRDVISFIKPKHLIPCHGDKPKQEAFTSLAEEMGYSTKAKTLHVLNEGDRVTVN